MFFDCYIKVKLVDNQFHLAFSIMLKGQASAFYYNKISKRLYDFTTIVEMTRTYFETEERRQKYLIEWRGITLHRIMTKHPKKT